MPEKIAEIDHYIENALPERRQTLRTLRELIHRWVPETVESMDYKMPTFSTDGIFASLASQKHHMSLYICNIPALDRHRDTLGHIDCGKSCIRFKKLEDLPMPSIEAILKESAANPKGHH